MKDERKKEGKHERMKGTNKKQTEKTEVSQEGEEELIDSSNETGKAGKTKEGKREDEDRHTPCRKDMQREERR